MDFIRKIIRDEINNIFEAFNFKSETDTFIPPQTVANIASVEHSTARCFARPLSSENEPNAVFVEPLRESC